MRRSLTALASLLALGAVAAVPVAVSPDAEATCFVALGEDTEDTTDDVMACRQDVWFHETGLKVDNLDAVQETPAATWDANPPTASVTDGAGSGAYATSVLHQNADAHDPREAFVATGSFTGAIDNVVTELYMFRPGATPGVNTGDPTNPRLGGDVHRVEAALYIANVQVATLAEETVKLQSAGNAAQRVTFVFRDVIDILKLIGDVEGEHTVEVRARGTGFGSDSHVVVYDTTEVPSGLVFNAPADLIAEIDEGNSAE